MSLTSSNQKKKSNQHSFYNFLCMKESYLKENMDTRCETSQFNDEVKSSCLQ